MIQKFFKTENDVSALVLRLMLGIVFFPHGAQKALGWFGGHGFSGTMQFFTGTMGIPAVFALAAIAAEFLGSLGLITGLFTRLSALGIGVNMVVAILMVHLPNGFFMNWFGDKKGEGFEYHLLVIAMTIALVIKGGGLLSADKFIADKLANRTVE